MVAIEVKNLKKNYGDFTAVNDISFKINKGEIFGFLGPNGAGKTSTINMMIGLSKPTSGEIFIDSIDVNKKLKHAQSIMGIVPDESNLYNEMNGFDNLCFCGALYGMSKNDREIRANQLLEIFNLKEAGSKLFKSYSKGMKRKLTIAAALMHSPSILFLDEPTTGIDVESSRQIRDMIISLKDKGTTIFLTTHYIEEAERLCDCVAFISNGKIVALGTVDELMEDVFNDNSIIFETDKNIKTYLNIIQNEFNTNKIKIINENSFVMISNQPILLIEVIKFLNDKKINVLEAKKIRPSLEDVFVKLTNDRQGDMK
ncbi:MAG: ABC transporter ATP-binding protein [Bacillota bacterium]|jgi:ABC-2 type transport system ATP-binding protein|nr:ABC transporter ATP-binding protein [Bacillota bacterium]